MNELQRDVSLSIIWDNLSESSLQTVNHSTNKSINTNFMITTQTIHEVFHINYLLCFPIHKRKWSLNRFCNSHNINGRITISKKKKPDSKCSWKDLNSWSPVFSTLLSSLRYADSTCVKLNVQEHSIKFYVQLILELWQRALSFN